MRNIATFLGSIGFLMFSSGAMAGAYSSNCPQHSAIHQRINKLENLIQSEEEVAKLTSSQAHADRMDLRSIRKEAADDMRANGSADLTQDQYDHLTALLDSQQREVMNQTGHAVLGSYPLRASNEY